MLTVETCVQKYDECKVNNNGIIPEYREFLTYSGIAGRQLSRLFGSSPYSKLQTAAGDTPNKLQIIRTPTATIMRQYGNFVAELGIVPPYGEWDQRGLKPTESGLRAKPHNLRWSELPATFLEWVSTNKVAGFDKAIAVIANTVPTDASKSDKSDGSFTRLIKDIRSWTPARRRNSEAEYKIELRKHLESLGHKMNEEFGESKYDLLVRREYPIEIKKDPNLAECDRLFGQLARHLQHQCKVVVLLMDATRNDKYDNFTALVDKYLNLGERLVEIIKR